MDKRQSDQYTALFRSVEQVLQRQLALDLPAGLYLVATPIGNLADISLRALGVLTSADLIYCEDKRHSARLLNHYNITSTLRSYHEHNAATERPKLLSLVAQGKSVALISDAGTPLISDPGYKLVAEAKKLDLQVVAIPGASAPLAALASAGLPTDVFTFAGFLPPKSSARKKRLLELAKSEGTLVFFESPKRLKASLKDMLDCYGDRQGAVARELTKLHETVTTGSLSKLAAEFSAFERIKGEIVVLVKANENKDVQLDEKQLALKIADELSKGSLRDAVQAICVTYDLPRSKVYNLAVAIKKGEWDGH